MTRLRAAVLTLLAMLAFAGNSVLCRFALKYTATDPASFTAIRIASGAVVLWLVVRLRVGRAKALGSWPSALALFVYAAAFSFAYISLTAATGALLLFGAVQGVMIGHGLWRGERLRAGVDQLRRRAEREQLQAEASERGNRRMLHLAHFCPMLGL